MNECWAYPAVGYLDRPRQTDPKKFYNSCEVAHDSYAGRRRGSARLADSTTATVRIAAATSDRVPLIGQRRKVEGAPLESSSARRMFSSSSGPNTSAINSTSRFHPRIWQATPNTANTAI